MRIFFKANNLTQVIDAMQPWKNESQFGEFIAEQSTFPTEHPSPNPNAKQLSAPRRRDLEALQYAYTRLQQVEEHLRNNKEDTQAITQLMSFVRSVRKVNPSHTAAHRFEMLNPLRAWLFWLPILFLQQSRGSPSVLLILAHYYTVALVVEPLFPEVGAAYFGSLSVGPIEEIARRLFSINVSQTSESDMTTPLSLMEYPIDMVSKFRSRMGWVQPQRTASFPTFEQTHFKLEPSADSPIYHYGNPAYNYSSESLMLPSTPVSATISPLSLEPYSHQYLGIPSPGGFGGYHSPASSIYGGEGSVGYSEGEEYMYDLQQGSGFGFGGFVTPSPHTVWI